MTRVEGRIRWGAVSAAAVLAIIVTAACAVLGGWQWERAHDRGEIVQSGPPVPIAEVMVPGEQPSGIGTAVEVTGEWSAPAAFVIEREINGEPAELLVVPLTVDADLTGTGEPATLGVLAGWLPSAQAGPLPEGDATVTGIVRGSEAAGHMIVDAWPGTIRMTSMSTAQLASEWDSPVYSAILATDEPLPGWNALPEPPATRSLDWQSATYAVEWWIFAAFAMFLAVRWIRDNGRITSAEPQEEDI